MINNLVKYINGESVKDNFCAKITMERSRDFFVRTYLNEFTLINLFKKNVNSIARFCFATHDKDTNENGQPVESHIHVLLRFKERKSLNAVKKFFPVSNDNDSIIQSTYIQVMSNERKALRYLIHKDNLEKFQYDRTIIYNQGYMVDLYLDNDLLIEKCDTTILALTDLLNGSPLREVALKYGRDFIYHYTQFRSLLNDIHEQETYITSVDNSEEFDTFLDFNKLPDIN